MDQQEGLFSRNKIDNDNQMLASGLSSLCKLWVDRIKFFRFLKCDKRNVHMTWLCWKSVFECSQGVNWNTKDLIAQIHLTYHYHVVIQYYRENLQHVINWLWIETSTNACYFNPGQSLEICMNIWYFIPYISETTNQPIAWLSVAFT